MCLYFVVVKNWRIFVEVLVFILFMKHKIRGHSNFSLTSTFTEYRGGGEKDGIYTVLVSVSTKETTGTRHRRFLDV